MEKISLSQGWRRAALPPGERGGCYTRAFLVERPAQHRYWLEVENAPAAPELWVNGSRAEPGACPEFSTLLHSGANELQLRTDADILPQPVWLYKAPLVCVRPHTLAVRVLSASVQAAELEASGQITGLAEVIVLLRDRSGRIRARTSAQEAARFRLRLRVPSPRFGTAEEPYYYRLETVLSADNQLETQFQRFAIPVE